MAELREPRGDGASRSERQYERSENQNIKNFSRKAPEEKYLLPPSIPYKEKEYDVDKPDYRYAREAEYRYSGRGGEFMPMAFEKSKEGRGSVSQGGPMLGDVSRPYPYHVGRPFRSNNASGMSLMGGGRGVDSCMENAVGMGLVGFRKEECRGESSGSDDESVGQRLNKGRKKIKMEFIADKSRRGVTFSKRKKGIMKKAYELNVLTKCEILLVVASETGHVYTFATPKLQPMIKQHENLIQQYLNGPCPGEGKYEGERLVEPVAYYKGEGYGYEVGRTPGAHTRTPHGYSPGYYHGYDGQPRM
jgi:SRF-type transcription factor (DNA-binding and dimerisation domain)